MRLETDQAHHGGIAQEKTKVVKQEWIIIQKNECGDEQQVKVIASGASEKKIAQAQEVEHDDGPEHRRCKPGNQGKEPKTNSDDHKSCSAVLCFAVEPVEQKIQNQEYQPGMKSRYRKHMQCTRMCKGIDDVPVNIRIMTG